MIIKIFEFQKIFFLKLKVLLVAKYHRKSFALTSLISSQWAFKKNSNFLGKKIEKSKIPHNFPQGWPGTVLLHQRVYTNGTSQKKNILSILAILLHHPLVYFCPGEPLNTDIDQQCATIFTSTSFGFTLLPCENFLR